MSKYILINSDNSNGFYDDAVHDTIPAGALEISNEDYSKFFSDNGKYVFKNIDGKAALSEITYTDEEIKQSKLNALDSQYKAQFNELAQSLGLATLASNDDTITSIKSDYAALKAEYNTKREEIING